MDKRIRHTKDVSVTLKHIEKTEVTKTKSDKQKTEVEEVKDPNANYYMCIGTFTNLKANLYGEYPLTGNRCKFLSDILVIVCLGVLSDNAMLPEFSTSHKLIASYVLGMMTILLIKLS